MRIVWSPVALQRVEDIAGMIAVERPLAAERWIRSIFSRAKQLASHPASGRMVPELGDPEIRQLPHPPYRIIYRIETKRVLVLTVRHGRQDDVAATELRDPDTW